MKRRLFALLAIPFPVLAQTRLSVDQIKPNQIIVSEELTRAADGTLLLSFQPANNYIQFFINGLSVRPVRDFTIAGRTITLIAAYATLDQTSTFDVFYYR